jgi:hypothetical protein
MKKSVGNGLLSISFNAIDLNTNIQVLRFAQDDNAKRLIVWKEIGCSLIHDHTFAPHYFHQTQPPHTVILSEAKDLDFFCCPSFIDVFNTNIQVLRSAQDDSRGRVVLKHRMTLQRGL